MLKGVGHRAICGARRWCWPGWRCCCSSRRREASSAARLTMRTLRFLLRKEYLQIFRDRLMVAQMLLLPVIQLALLANAATFEVKSAQLVVVDEDRSATSRGLVDRLRASRDGSSLSAASPSMDLADEAMLRREAGVILRIPARLRARPRPHAHGARCSSCSTRRTAPRAGVTLSYAQRIIAEYASRAGATLRLSAPVRRPCRVSDARRADARLVQPGARLPATTWCRESSCSS